MTSFTCRSRPEPSSIYGKPLTGVKVVLDPGHGGQDPGALGVPGENGPMEAELNLAVAKALSFRLEQLGASVILTRQEDGHISLNEPDAFGGKGGGGLLPLPAPQQHR